MESKPFTKIVSRLHYRGQEICHTIDGYFFTPWGIVAVSWAREGNAAFTIIRNGRIYEHYVPDAPTYAGEVEEWMTAVVGRWAADVAAYATRYVQ